MKKLFFLLSFVTLAFSSAFARSITRTGLIILRPIREVIPVPNNASIDNGKITINETDFK